MRLGEFVDVMETFGCDLQHEGMGDFIALYNLVAVNMLNNRNKGKRGHVAADALRHLAKCKGKYYLALNSTMSAAIRPLLEADAAALEYFGIRMEKRTPCAVAEALAALHLD